MHVFKNLLKKENSMLLAEDSEEVFCAQPTSPVKEAPEIFVLHVFLSKHRLSHTGTRTVLCHKSKPKSVK